MPSRRFKLKDYLKDMLNNETILTGKCREDFLEWYHHNAILKLQGRTVFAIEFLHIPFVMQHATIVNFFDSCDMFIYIVAVEKNCGDFAFRPEIIGFYGNHDGIYHTTRQEAIKQAILKANEIYNELHEKT